MLKNRRKEKQNLKRAGKQLFIFEKDAAILRRYFNDFYSFMLLFVYVVLCLYVCMFVFAKSAGGDDFDNCTVFLVTMPQKAE